MGKILIRKFYIIFCTIILFRKNYLFISSWYKVRLIVIDLKKLRGVIIIVHIGLYNRRIFLENKLLITGILWEKYFGQNKINL